MRAATLCVRFKMENSTNAGLFESLVCDPASAVRRTQQMRLTLFFFYSVSCCSGMKSMRCALTRRPQPLQIKYNCNEQDVADDNQVQTNTARARFFFLSSLRRCLFFYYFSLEHSAFPSCARRHNRTEERPTDARGA